MLRSGELVVIELFLMWIHTSYPNIRSLLILEFFSYYL